jgi:hypothetical protein
MLFTAVTMWMGYDAQPEHQAASAVAPPVEQVGLRTRYRIETAHCDSENTGARRKCERQARARILGQLKQDAAQLYFR